MATAVDLQSYISGDTIFITPTGSRLYGLANEQSDYDFTIVTAPGRRISSSVIQDGLDIRRVDFHTYYAGLRDKPGGVYIEALYSKQKLAGPRAPEFMDLLNSFVPTVAPLRSTMFKMATAVLHDERYKRVRFAAYLASRWNQWYWSGQQYYDPSPTGAELEAIEAIASELLPLSYEERRAIFSQELFFIDLPRALETYRLNLNPRAI